MAKNCFIFSCCIVFILGIKFSIGQDNGQRGRIVSTARTQIAVRELTNHNDGKEVETYLQYVGLKKGAPWCSAFVCWCYAQDCVSNPRNALAASWFRDQEKIIYDRRFPKKTKPIHQGDPFGIWFEELNGIHHVGMVLIWTGQWVVTIEGNTNDAGSREGDGVYLKKRLRKQIYQVAQWIK